MVNEGAIDPRDQLRTFEARWRDELRRVSLVAELDVTREELRLALFCIGFVWQLERTIARATSRMEANFPAAFVVALAGTASAELEGRTTWEPIVEHAGLPYEQPTTSALGKCFLSCLELLGLPTFPELDDERALRYVARLLLHGGVPIDHLDELWEVSAKEVRRLGSRDPVAIHAALVERAEAKRLYGAPTSIQRFLCYGGEFAVDFLDRSLDLLQHLEAGGDTSTRTFGLPKRYVDRGLWLRDARMLPGMGGAATSTPTTNAYVAFDPYVLGVHVVGPPVVSREDVVWSFVVDGHREELTARLRGLSSTTPEVSLLLPAGAQSVDVERDGGEGPATLRLNDAADPVLIFTTDGRLVERRSRIPLDPVWVLRPSAQTIELDQERVIEEHAHVPRWDHWVATLIDVAGLQELRLGGRTRRLVQTERSAQLIGWEPIPGVTTRDGFDVGSGWPEVQLPGTLAGAAWLVSVGSVDSLTRREMMVEVGAEGSVIAVATLADDLVGVPVEIAAKGPLGRSLRTTVVVQPGLVVEASPTPRVPVEGGLSPVTVTLTGPVTASALVESTERSTTFRDGVGRALVVEPLSVSLQHLRDRSGSSWRFERLNLDLDAFLDDPGSLQVRLPGDSGGASLVVHDGDGQVVQRVEPDGRRRSDESVVFDLRRITDTVRTAGVASLTIESEVWSGRACRIRPARLFSHIDASLDRGIIQFVGLRVPRIEVALYRRLVPRSAPILLDVPEGDEHPTVVLPDEAIGCGGIRLLVREHDPWVAEPWPVLPPLPMDPGETLDDARLNIRDLDLDWDEDVLFGATIFGSYLTHTSQLVPDASTDDLLWVFLHAHQMHVPRGGNAIRGEIGERLSGDPLAVAAAGVALGLDGKGLAEALTSTGAVGAAVPASLDLDDAATWWNHWPGAAALGVSAHLWHRVDDGDVAAAELFLRERCGEVTASLLTGEWDDVLAMPHFSMEYTLDIPLAIVREQFREAAIVPTTMLSSDARAMDGMRLFACLKTSDQLHDLVAQADNIVWHITERSIGGALSPTMREALRKRAPSAAAAGDWRLLPAVSLALCLQARIAARAPEPSQVFTSRSRHQLLTLASCVPSLVGADLTMAELMIQGAAT